MSISAALSLIAALAAAPPWAQADQSPDSPRGASVKWHARGEHVSEERPSRSLSIQASSVEHSTLSWRAGSNKPLTAAEPRVDAAGPTQTEPAATKGPASAAKVSAPAARVRPVVNHEPVRVPASRVRRIPTPPSRARTRDAVMQVSSNAPEADADPFNSRDSDDKKPLDLDEPTSSATEPQASDEPAPRERDSDPFPEERVPNLLDEDRSTTPEREPSEPDSERLMLDEPTIPESEPDMTQPTPYEPESSLEDVEVSPEADRSCATEQRDCETAIEELRGRDIRKIVPAILMTDSQGQAYVEGRDFPCECALGLRTTYQGRHWAPVTFTWKASAQCHKPLYFEDVQLERYGHSWNPVIQPFASAAHFFCSVPLLPYKMGLTPPSECMYTLGYYRPGDCAPYMIEPIPLSLRAGASQLLAVTGFTFWFWPPPTGAP